MLFIALFFSTFLFPSAQVGTILTLLVCAGISLGTSLVLSLGEGSIPKIQLFLFGVMLSGGLFASIHKAQEIMNENTLSHSRGIDSFAGFTGHCGPNISVALQGFINQLVPNKAKAELREYFLMNQCRNEHFLILERTGGIECAGRESPLDCRVRWMGVFAERGYWNYSVRKMFYNRILELWNQNKKEDALVNYVLKDQEYETNRLDLLKQVGADELGGTIPPATLLKEEIDNLRLTETIFAKASTLMDENTEGGVSPNMIKFKDALADASKKVAKIPELEKELIRKSDQL